MKQQRFRHGRKALAVFLIGSLLAVNLTGCRILSGFLDTTAYTRIQGERVREEVVIRPLETLPMEGSVTKEEVLDALAGARGAVAPVSLRVNPDIGAHTHANITT